jgi:hypothetical protein
LRRADELLNSFAQHNDQARTSPRP